MRLVERTDIPRAASQFEVVDRVRYFGEVTRVFERGDGGEGYSSTPSSR